MQVPRSRAKHRKSLGGGGHRPALEGLARRLRRLVPRRPSAPTHACIMAAHLKSPSRPSLRKSSRAREMPHSGVTGLEALGSPGVLTTS